MTYQALQFGSVAPNDGETIHSAMRKIDNMLAEIFDLLAAPDVYPAYLQSLAGLTAAGMVRRMADGGAATLPLGALGEVLLGADSPAAVRLALQLGSAAMLGTAGANSVVTRDAAGKIPAGDLPALDINTVHDAADEAAMLALPAEQGDFCIRPTADPETLEVYLLAGADPTVLANWRLIAVRGPGAVSMVFGRTGSVRISDLPALAGAVDPDDELVLLDVSTGVHCRVRQADLLAGLGGALTASVVSGLLVGGTAAVPTIAISGLRLADASGQIAAGQAGLILYDISTGVPFRQSLAGLIGALAARGAVDDTDQVMVALEGGGARRASVAALLAGRRLDRPVLAGAVTAMQPRRDIAGPVALDVSRPERVYALRLVGAATVVLPDRNPAADGLTQIKLIIDQDAIGGRALVLQPPAGDHLRWHAGLAQQVCLTPSGRTIIDISGLAGEQRWDVTVSYKDE